MQEGTAVGGMAGSGRAWEWVAQEARRAVGVGDTGGWREGAAVEKGRAAAGSGSGRHGSGWYGGVGTGIWGEYGSGGREAQ